MKKGSNFEFALFQGLLGPLIGLVFSMFGYCGQFTPYCTDT